MKVARANNHTFLVHDDKQNEFSVLEYVDGIWCADCQSVRCDHVKAVLKAHPEAAVPVEVQP